MKTKHIVQILLLVGCFAVRAQTTNSLTTTNTPAAPKPMGYTLILTMDWIKIANPTEADIRSALNTPASDGLASNGLRAAVFLIVADGETEQIQVNMRFAGSRLNI